MEEIKTKIKVVDSIMGQGKTTWAINYMKENPDKRFIYVTPFLDECERVRAEIPTMKTPYVDYDNNESKLETFRQYLLKGESVITTHSLMSKFDLDIQETIRIGEYTLILDEVTNVAEMYEFETATNKDIFLNDFTYIDKDKYVCWDEEKHPSELFERGSYFYGEMILCLNRHLVLVNNNILMWELPTELFKSFEDVYILTYLFEGSLQKPYFDLFNVKYEYLSLDKGNLVPYKETSKEVKQEIRSLINLVDNPKL